MGSNKDLAAIIAMAIQNEIETYEFYSAAAEKMKDASVKKLFTELAEEEKQHQEILSNLDLSNYSKIPTYDLPDYALAEKIDRPVLSIDMKFIDAIAVAIKNEEASMLLYAGLAAASDNPEQQKLFNSLSNMEKGHKARLEEIYNNAAYAELW
ncbi:MAG: ferritin family protein [Syntrophomonadaceae bacterium]|nr:ferritin family protein [Syntrophomonadaceae bacterium]